jgi:Fe2+ or Zn2+ uptake regulation protein
MSQDEILDTLRTAGYRLTAPRRRMVDLLLEAEAPLTAEEIHRRVRQAALDANLSTIYRNLATFCELGWLEAVPGTNGERYYQLNSAAEPHMSVLCLDCGQVTSLRVEVGGRLNAAVRDMGFDTQGLRVTMAAHCEHLCEHKVVEQ